MSPSEKRTIRSFVQRLCSIHHSLFRQAHDPGLTLTEALRECRELGEDLINLTDDPDMPPIAYDRIFQGYLKQLLSKKDPPHA